MFIYNLSVLIQLYEHDHLILVINYENNIRYKYNYIRKILICKFTQF